MDIIQTATKITALFAPFFGKSKTIKKIGAEIGEATDTELSLLWDKVKPWFIEEYEEDKPIDETFEESDVKALLKTNLKKADEATKATIEQALQQKEAATKITNTSTVTGKNNQVFQGINNSTIQTHSGTGDNVVGDKKIYNIDKIDNANFS